MQLIPKRTGNSKAVSVSRVVATALCVSPLWYAVAASPSAPQNSPVPTRVIDANTIPFEPPIVYPGYGPQMKEFKVEDARDKGLGTRRSTLSRDLMFRPEDRRTFKALHPFLLGKVPAPIVVETPKTPAAK